LRLSGFLDLSVADAGRARTDPLIRAIQNCPDRLEVHIPAPIGDVVGVADLMSELRAFAAHIANSCHF
jgi:hypothetical protein